MSSIGCRILKRNLFIFIKHLVKCKKKRLGEILLRIKMNDWLVKNHITLRNFPQD